MPELIFNILNFILQLNKLKTDKKKHLQQKYVSNQKNAAQNAIKTTTPNTNKD